MKKNKVVLFYFIFEDMKKQSRMRTNWNW